MENNNQNISSIFANNFFRIPNYQRGYAWKGRQLMDLWEDIIDIPKKNNGLYAPHYTGALSLKQIPFEKLTSTEQKMSYKGGCFYDVVDGQQRLTTIIILLFVLHKKLNDSELLQTYIRTEGEVPIYKFTYGDSSSENSRYLKRKIFEDEREMMGEKNVYTNNLSEAKSFFEEKVKDLTEDEVKEIFYKIAGALLFDIKIIKDDLDVQVVFETMNNRGKPLTILEKLKNRLLFLVNKLSCDAKDELSKDINDSWGRVYSWLGKNEVIMLDEDEFLSSYLTLIRQPADYSFSTKDAERKVFEMFCTRAQLYNRSYRRDLSKNAEKEDEISYKKIQDFAREIADFIPHWYRVHFPDMSKSIDEKIYKIRCMNNSKEMKLFLAKLLWMEQGNEEAVSKCLEKVIKILFRNRLPIQNIKDERVFASHARFLHTTKAEEDTMEEKKKYTIEDLNTELDDTLKNEISYTSLRDGFRNLFNHVYNPIGYYKWAGLKFFLFEYEECIRKKEHEKEKKHLTWDLFSETSIEHVMPKTWWEHWAKTMEEYLQGRDFSQEEERFAKNTLINTLGNLTIISDCKNPSLGNNPWSLKKKAYNYGFLSEIIISEEKEWNANAIYDRGKKMLDCLIDYIGGVSPVSVEEKERYENELLFVDDKYLPLQ